jgi:hypothetical protein
MKRLNECGCGCGGTATGCMASQEGNEPQNYMFMGNLQVIKRAIDAMMELDPAEVDALLSDGHNWAADHIATSKDDIEEVAGFLINRLGGHRDRPMRMEEPGTSLMGVPMMGMQKHSIHTFESFNYRRKK